MRRRSALLGLIAVLLGCAILGVVGFGVEDRLDPLSLTISGTSSAEGEALAERHFGDASQFAILLDGPLPAIERQGPPLVRALRHTPRATVISPWDRGTTTALRPGPRKALIIVDYHVPLATAMRDTVPELEGVLEDHVSSPLHATQSGFAPVSRALQQETIGATERAELLAVPLLLIVLLLVFRSVLAAAIPLAFGALTVLAGRGVLVVLSSFMTVDAISLVVCTMMGLALGVDYSLLIVSRFREELAEGHPPLEAALRSRATAGRTTVFAGSTLLAALALSAYVQPGSLLLSLAVTVGVATILSVLVAIAGLPGLLALLGDRVNAGSLGSRGGAPRSGSRVAALAGRALRRPGLAAILIAIPLALLAAPALGLSTAAPGLDELPSSNGARQSAEQIADAVGPGWEAPFVVVAAAPEGPITTPRRLALLSRWQRRIAAQPGIRAVIGPAAVGKGTKPLRELGESFTGKNGPASLTKLGPGLHHASSAVSELRDGLAQAAEGSGLLGEGAGRAEQGAELLAGGLGLAAEEGAKAGDALEGLASGTKRLNQGQRKTAAATLNLALEMRSLLPTIRGNALGRARRLAESLESEAKENPALEKRAAEARVMARVLSSIRNEVRRLRDLANSVNGGLNKLVKGGRELEGGTQTLAGAAGGLSSGLGELSDGAGRLASGLGALQGGAGQLQSHLSDGYQESRPLETGLRRAGVRVAATAGPLAAGARRLQRSSPRLFDSGYFVLSALEGASPRRRALAGEAVSLEGGGQAARMLVIPKHGLNTPQSREIGDRLGVDAKRIASQGGLETGVGGGAATVNDYGSVTRARIPLVVGAVVIACFLMLLLILRSPILAGIAVVLNLASVGAAIGVMALVCKIPDGYPLGGHPYIDTVGAAAIFGVTFGLSIDYAVFLLARMREHYREHGDNSAAIEYGLEKTAGVITGAAAIMAAVFISFAAAPIATVSQMGVGLTVAILLDATVVRIVLLPALMLLFGDRVWHTPRWLARLLPAREARV